jgi:uncharacterized protein (TIGR02246 family)
MYRRLSLVLVLVAGCTSAPAERSPGKAPAGEPLAAMDIAAIRASDSAFVSAMASGDAAAVAAIYVPDAHVLPPDAPPVEGRAAIQQFFAGFLGAYHVTAVVSSDEIEGRGDLAFARGHYTLEGTPKAAGTPPLHEEGKFLEVLRRQPDGTWRLAADMWSPNGPPPGSK